MKYILLCVILLTGCASLTEKYPATCDVRQNDKQGTGYTVGTFPCQLTHHEGKDATP